MLQDNTQIMPVFEEMYEVAKNIGNLRMQYLALVKLMYLAQNTKTNERLKYYSECLEKINPNKNVVDENGMVGPEIIWYQILSA